MYTTQIDIGKNFYDWYVLDFYCLDSHGHMVWTNQYVTQHMNNPDVLIFMKNFQDRVDLLNQEYQE